MLACSWLLAVSEHGVTAVATFFAMISVVELVTSPISGWLADQYSRRRLAMIADSMRAAAAVALGACLHTETFYWSIWMSTLIFAGCDRLSLTATQSMIPKIGDGYPPTVGNSAACFFMQVGSLAAAASVGLSLLVLSPSVVMLTIAFFFAASVLSMACVSIKGIDPGGCENQSPPTLHIDVPLLRLCLIYCLLYTCGLLVSAIGPSFVFQELRGNAVDFGNLEISWSLGSIIGAVLLIPLSYFASSVRVEIVTLWVTAISFASLKALDLPWVLVAIGIIGVSYNLGKVAIEVRLQAVVPRRALGRAKGLAHCGAVTLGVILLGMIGLAGTSISPTTIFLLLSLAITVCTVLLLTLVR
jgi:MFS family permease